MNHYLAAYTKVNSKWIKDLNARKHKLLEENIGGMLLDSGLDEDIFFNLIPKAAKAKLNKWNNIELKVSAQL